MKAAERLAAMTRQETVGGCQEMIRQIDAAAAAAGEAAAATKEAATYKVAAAAASKVAAAIELRGSSSDQA